jgi:hypothetical protein
MGVSRQTINSIEQIATHRRCRSRDSSGPRAAQWIGGDPRSGLESLGIMTGVGALFLFGRGSETIRGLRGGGRDERFRQIDVHATALVGLAVILAIIVGVPWLHAASRPCRSGCVVGASDGRSQAGAAPSRSVGTRVSRVGASAVRVDSRVAASSGGESQAGPLPPSQLSSAGVGGRVRPSA